MQFIKPSSLVSVVASRIEHVHSVVVMGVLVVVVAVVGMFACHLFKYAHIVSSCFNICYACLNSCLKLALNTVFNICLTQLEQLLNIVYTSFKHRFHIFDIFKI